MILAAILRNYKCYKGINIIPFCSDDVQDMNIIIGDNGVGKSAILEGLDTFFNDAPWIVNNEIRDKKECSVGAVMLIQKYFVGACLDAREKSILEEISDYFWTIPDTNPFIRRGYTDFISFRSQVTNCRADYYLMIVGREYEQKDIQFLTFTKTIANSLTIDPKPTSKTLSGLIDKVLSCYTYIYIPVETSISDFVKLQNQSMQALTDSNVKDDIAANLKKRFITRKKTGSKREEKRCLLDYVNDALESYVDRIENDIQQIHSGYSYKPGPRQVSKLTANHITDAIISAFYSRRTFKKDGKDISNLSSGEKRIILIDIISAFLRKNNPSRELIIGIDEPENSLHVSKCYNQFKKIEEIAEGYGHQMFVTTHWYGSLPSLSKGNLIHIDSHSTPSTYSISNFYENRGGMPNDIQLKGYFDLTSSLLYAFRNSAQHWILVEGYEDKRYMEYHLKDSNIRIIPVGGCGNVKKLYEYLYIPMTSNDFDYKTNKILCLIDTDALLSIPNVPSGEDKGHLLLRRLHETETGEISLKKVEDPTRRETEVEEILDPKKFYDSLMTTIDHYGDEVDKEAFATFEFDDTAKTSRIKGDGGILKVKVLGRNANDDKKRILDFVDSHKDSIAKEYVSMPYEGSDLSWVIALKNLLDPVKKN